MSRTQRVTAAVGGRPLAGAVVLAVAVGAFTMSADASSGAGSSGSFSEYASAPGLGYSDITGHAQLVRTGSGKSIATTEIQGLLANTTYAVHVHALGCADLAGHYFYSGPVVDGDGPNADELWPGPITTNAAGNGHGRTAVGATAAATARSVVVHATPTGGPRIACADLS